MFEDENEMRKTIAAIMQQYKTLFLFEGVAFIALGLFALLAPVLFSLTLELFIGWLCIFTACVQAVRWAQAKNMPNSSSTVASIFLYLAVGLLLVSYPLSGILTLNLLIACYFILDAIFKLTSAIQLRPANRWGWICVSGILSMLLAMLIILSWPTGAPYVLAILVGINLLFTGFVQLGLLWAIPSSK